VGRVLGGLGSCAAVVGGSSRSDTGESFTRGSAKTGGRQRDT